MTEVITCASCGQELRVPLEYAGKLLRCPACHDSFVAKPRNPPPTPAEIDPLDLELGESAVDAGRSRDDGSAVQPAAASLPAAPSPRPARVRPAPKPAPSGNKLVYGLVAGLGAIIVISIVALVWAANRDEDWKPRFERESREDVVEAFRNQKPLKDDEIANEMKPFFDRLGKAFRRDNRNELASHFDVDRLYDELIALDMIRFDRREKRDFLAGMRAGIGNTLEKQAPLLAWESCEIKQIKKLVGNEAVVIIRHQQKNGTTMKMRWWLSQRSGTWKVYDLEDLDMGIRFSTSIASIVGAVKAEGMARLKEIVSASDALREALLALDLRQDAAAAERSLKRIAAVKLPNHLEAFRWFVTGAAQAQRQQWQLALDSWEKAHQFRADMPVLDLARGIACSRLGHAELALKHLDAYRDVLGEDSQVCEARGLALRWQKRFPEALDCYRRSLDFDPKNADALQGFMLALGPNDQRDELGKRFSKLDSLHENFDIFTADCRKNNDAASLVELARTMLAIYPRHVPAKFNLALGLAWLGKGDEAIPHFKKALADEKDAGKHDNYLAQFLPSIATMGKVLEIYQVVPDKKAAFRLLAAPLKRNYQTDELRRLVTAHAKKHADDSQLALYQADILVSDGKYQEADKLFVAAMVKPPDLATLTLFRSDRVLARYHTGNALTALNDIGPRRDTFQQLVNLCFQDQKFDLLQTLLDDQAKHDPNDFTLLSSRFRLKIKQDKVDEGIALFKSALAKPNLDQFQQRNLISSFLFAMEDAGKAFEGYQAVPDRKYALQSLGNSLGSSGDTKTLKKILEAHRLLHADDPWLAFLDAELFLAEKSLDKAERVLRKVGADRIPQDLRYRWRNLHVLVLYRLGRYLEAYQSVEPRQETYFQLVNLLTNDRKGPELEKLAAAHRLHAGNDANVVYQEACAKVFRKKPALAIVLFQRAYRLEIDQNRRADYVSGFVIHMHSIGQGFEAYRACPDQIAAFQTLAGQLQFQKKEKELSQLLTEHTRRHPEDWNLRFYRGELHMLRGEFTDAIREFKTALAGKLPRGNDWQVRNGLQRAMIKAGKIAQLYHDLGPGRRTFETLANQCSADKNADQLEALLAVHRQHEPDNADLEAWAFDVHWLRSDFEGALKVLRDQRTGIFANQRFQWKFNHYLVRCLIKLKRTREAIQEAEALVKAHKGNAVSIILAQAASGDVKLTVAAMEKRIGQRYLLEDCYRDFELGPILRGDAFRDFRQRFPEPAPNRFGQDQFDD